MIKMRTVKCPQCHSSKVKEVDYMGLRCIVCRDCDYDERLEYDIVPEEDTNQKEKGRYHVYKKGGHGRT